MEATITRHQTEMSSSQAMCPGTVAGPYSDRSSSNLGLKGRRDPTGCLRRIGLFSSSVTAASPAFLNEIGPWHLDRANALAQELYSHVASQTYTSAPTAYTQVAIPNFECSSANINPKPMHEVWLRSACRIRLLVGV